SAGDLWMSDVMYGPKIRDARRQRQTSLIAFIDDATRVVPFAVFTFSEGAITYLSVLEQALRRRGIPKRLYGDNGAAFRSKQLAVVCAKLGIALIHAKPYKPQGKGYVSHCTSFARFDGIFERLRFVSLLPCFFTRAWSRGGSYRHSPLSLSACARKRSLLRDPFTVDVATPSW